MNHKISSCVSLCESILLGAMQNFHFENKNKYHFNFLYRRGRKQTHKTHRLTLSFRKVST